ncbi:MAG: NAD-dependent epimerase/dehydratase family protein [Deltaproteobacteria bacterium]|nr:NAD-dependent epimerase/dehydratase family protein [Deltaproteobacteria bacterium]
MEYRGISLVTGAGGFVGRHLVALLVRRGVRVRASALAHEDMDAITGRGVEVVRADLTQASTLPPLFAGGVDRVFHAGAICNLSTPYAVLRRVNVDGVERITGLALAAGVRSFVHLSSTSVYGRYRAVPLTEDAPREPQEDYGRSKRDGEDVVWRRIREGLPATVLRPCTVYGPGCTDGAGKVFSRPASLGAIPGDGRQRLSNVRVEDVAGAAYHLSLREDAAGHAFNVADDSHPAIEEALGLAAAAFGTRPPRLHLPVGVVAAAARVQGLAARIARRIPDLELDAVRYLNDDYVVDNARLAAAGYRLLYPDFTQSMRELGRRYLEEQAA